MNKFVAFDLEIFKKVEGDDWDKYWPLGISCAGLKDSESPKVSLFYRPDYGRQTKADAAAILFALETYVRNGFTIVTVNGAKFDFRVLAEETGQPERCAKLAADHVDFMIACVCKYGWRLGLQTLAEGAGHKGKAKDLQTRGGIIERPDGGTIPDLWQTDPEACLTYQIDDCDATLAIATTAAKRGFIGWNSASGKPYRISTKTGFPTVRQAMAWKVPDTSWMPDPPRRYDLVQWINDVLPAKDRIFVKGALP